MTTISQEELLDIVFKFNVSKSLQKIVVEKDEILHLCKFARDNPEKFSEEDKNIMTRIVMYHFNLIET